MRFVTVQTGIGPQPGLLDGEHIFLLAPLLRRAAGGRRAADAAGDLVSFIERGSLTAARAALALGRRLVRADR
ncbi:MAG: hypothetical protein QN174_10505, partial [Armatimonadota bacterium]|nr:hypothetical protein [Armatimonadota bacterium]